METFLFYIIEIKVHSLKGSPERGCTIDPALQGESSPSTIESSPNTIESFQSTMKSSQSRREDGIGENTRKKSDYACFGSW